MKIKRMYSTGLAVRKAAHFNPRVVAMTSVLLSSACGAAGGESEVDAIEGI